LTDSLSVQIKKPTLFNIFKINQSMIFGMMIEATAPRATSLEGVAHTSETFRDKSILKEKDKPLNNKKAGAPDANFRKRSSPAATSGTFTGNLKRASLSGSSSNIPSLGVDKAPAENIVEKALKSTPLSGSSSDIPGHGVDRAPSVHVQNRLTQHDFNIKLQGGSSEPPSPARSPLQEISSGSPLGPFNPSHPAFVYMTFSSIALNPGRSNAIEPYKRRNLNKIRIGILQELPAFSEKQD